MGAWRLKINGVVYTTYKQLRFKKERNTLGEIEFILYSTTAADYTNNVNYNKKITLEEYNKTTGLYKEIYKGYIRDVEKTTFKNSKVTGLTPAIKLFDRTWTERKQYTNVASNTIVSEVASGIMNVGTNNVTTVITTRFELDNKLKSIAKVANVNNAEWWEAEDGLGEDTINMDTSRYDSTSVETITVGYSSSLTGDNIDSDKIYNCITTIGKGDGINQVQALSYGFCFYQPDTTAAMTATSTSVTITNATGLASSNGIIYINNEKILFANRTGLNLYNLTRGYDSTTAVAHSSGMRVWYAGTTTDEFTKLNPAPDSSVEQYGIREFPYYDKRIVKDLTGDPNESCGVITSRLFDRFKEPVRTISIKKRRLYLGDIAVGKTITVVDSTTGLNEDFKVYSIEMINNRGRSESSLNFVVNNLQYNFSTELDELKKDMDTTGMYEQGATNLFTVDQAENCDIGYPLTLRFYLPADTKAINKALLNFQVKNYRTYISSGVTSYGSDSSVISDSASTVASVTMTHPLNWTDIVSITTSSDSCEGAFLTYSMKYFAADTTTYDKGTTGVVFQWRIKDDDGNYYPVSNGSSAGIIAAGTYWNNDTFDGGNVSVYIPGNQRNKTFTLQAIGQSTPDLPWYWYAQASYMTFERHTHSLSYGIGEPDPISLPSNVAVTINGDAVTGSPFSDLNNTGIDFTSLLEDVGADNWVEIEFTPNQNVRIEASASIQIYLESTI